MFLNTTCGRMIGKKMVLGSKFKDMANFMNAGGEKQEGFIGLQDHGNDVWYRNIKIKILD